MYKRINELEEENRKLLEAFNSSPIENHSVISKLTANRKSQNISNSKNNG